MIPKKIHYCWFGEKDYPCIVKECMVTWKQFLPDWEFVEWNETNSPIDHPFVKKSLKEKKYAFAADYVRLYALSKEGGVYLDTDMELIKSLNPLLSNRFFAAYEDENKNWLSCGVIGSIPEHEILKRMLAYYENITNYEPIPKILTKVVRDSIECWQEGDMFLSRDFFYPYNPFDSSQKVKFLMFKNITDNTYAIHHWNYSWKPSYFERLISFIKKNLK